MVFPLLTTNGLTTQPDVSFKRRLAPKARKALLLWAVGLLSGCLASPTAGEVVQPGVAEAVLELRARGTDIVPVRLTYPSDNSGQPLPGPHPALVYVQGGFVPETAYRWHARALASLGYVVAHPTHPNDLAFFAVDNAGVVRSTLLRPPSGSLFSGLVDPKRIAVAGHSLGGVVAVKAALAHPFSAIAVHASFPDPADEGTLRQTQGLPSLLLSGGRDCQALEAQVGEGFARLSSPAAWVRLPGASHFQFTDNDARDDQNEACRPTAALADTHDAIVQSMNRFLEAAFAGRALARAELGPPAEVTVK